MTIKVKPLVWRGKFAHGVGGILYAVDQDHDFAILAKVDGPGTMKSFHATAEAAKAAAQADYEARILSAIEPVDPATIRAEALREAIVRIITQDHLQLLADFDVDGDIYRKDPECAASAYATANAILALIDKEQDR